ncbi:MAG: DUF4401 domain-containing protein [Gemmataceae bacterium]|nr:DUF4401 domain-containing protein [Gemmataceae bacterium]
MAQVRLLFVRHGRREPVVVHHPLTWRPARAEPEKEDEADDCPPETSTPSTEPEKKGEAGPAVSLEVPYSLKALISKTNRKALEEQKRTKDKAAPLTTEGKKGSTKLALTLRGLEVKPKAILTSDHEHAKETGALISKGYTPDKQPPVIPDVKALSPPPASGCLTLGNIAEAAKSKGVEFEAGGGFVLVGHENRLSQLVTLATGTRIRPLDLLDVVCVEAPSFRELQLGTGKVAWRIPVRAHGEEDLRKKLATKITVANITAGFTFTSLIQILMNASVPTENTLFGENAQASAWLAVVAIGCLTIALALFIAAVYIYDRLNMPHGFWGLNRAAKSDRLPAHARKQKDKEGLIYVHMVHAWMWVFTPGIFFATLGLLLTVASRSSWWVALGVALLLLLVVLYYRRIRPDLGVD